MRIIAGEFRGRRLTAPDGLKTRPMLARVREALFNILGSRVVNARVADCFSGTGAIGLEALSRGAAHVLWPMAVDASPKADVSAPMDVA